MSHTIEFWRWRVTDKVSRRCFVTRYPMAQADALDFDPAAERVEGSLEQRVVHDDPRSYKHERAAAPSGTGIR